MNKKAQLGLLEFKWLAIGLVIGIVITLAFVFMANKGIVIPFRLSFLCP